MSLKENVKFSTNLLGIFVKFYSGIEILGKLRMKINILLAVLSKIKMVLKSLRYGESIPTKFICKIFLLNKNK